jgi:DNA polymerase V
MAQFPVEDSWGVGRKWAAQLEGIGIHTAQAMALPDTNHDLFLQHFGVVMARTKEELQRGVGLLDFSRPEDLQADLFESPVVANKAVMDTLDAINCKLGRGLRVLQLAGGGPTLPGE